MPCNNCQSVFSHRYPKVSIAFLSWNRGHYLRATLESAKYCITYPNVEWIIIDNCSTEKYLLQYFNELSWVDKLIVKKCNFADALNYIIEISSGEILIIWPDDMQFIIKGGWLENYIDILYEYKNISSVSINALRRKTINNTFGLKKYTYIRNFARELIKNKINFRRQTICKSNNKSVAISMGWRSHCIIGAGICSVAKKSVWEYLGGWKKQVDGFDSLVDATLGAESHMISIAETIKPLYQIAASLYPVAADIVTDLTGTKAKVRGNNRIGNYLKPRNGIFYYQIFNCDQIPYNFNFKKPIAFEDIVEPIGFKLPLDKRGNLLKTDINTNIVEPIK